MYIFLEKLDSILDFGAIFGILFWKFFLPKSVVFGKVALLKVTKEVR